MFINIKSVLSPKPVIDHDDPSTPINLTVDFSLSFVIGAVISQVYSKDEKSVAYAYRLRRFMITFMLEN